MRKIADLLAGLSAEEHQALSSALREGLGQAARAERCLTDDDLRQGDAAQLLGYLSTAIEQLDQARDIARRMT
jgi:hypothetical protein